MASPELQNVIKMLLQVRETESPEMSVEQSRAWADSFSAICPPPDGTRLETTNVAGMRAEWVCGPGARSEATVLYFHGGGYVIGSGNRIVDWSPDSLSAARCAS
jgi:acetyl esterase/lipase